MHRSCRFRCQHTNTHTNRCFTPWANSVVETLQLEATHGRDNLSCSAQINKETVCAQHGAVTRMAVTDPPAADSAAVSRCTSTRIEGGPDGHMEDDTAMDGEIMGSGKEGMQNMMVVGIPRCYEQQVIQTCA